MVAFSGVALVNNSVNKDEVIEIKDSKEVLQATPCQDKMIDLHEYAIGYRADNIALLNKYMAICDRNDRK